MEEALGFQGQLEGVTIRRDGVAVVKFLMDASQLGRVTRLAPWKEQLLTIAVRPAPVSVISSRKQQTVEDV